MTTAEQVKAAIDAGAWGSDYAAPRVTVRGDEALVVVRGETLDLSKVRALSDKADIELRATIERLAAGQVPS